MDKITLLNDNKPLAKTYKLELDGGIKKIDFNCGYHVCFGAFEYENIEGLYNIIESIQTIKHCALLRGEEINKDGKAKRRIKRKQGNDMPTIKESAHHWIWLDMDHYQGIASPETLVAELLPSEFQNVSYIYQYSNSCFVPGEEENETKMHLFFVNDTALTNEELKRYVEDCTKIDDSGVIHAVQPIYVAPPSFENGAVDPFANRARIGLVKKENDVVKNLIIPAPPRKGTTRLPGGEIISHNSTGVGYMGYLNNISGSHTGHDNIKRAVASYYAVYGKNCNWEWFDTCVHSALVRAGHPNTTDRSSLPYLNQLRDCAFNLIPSPFNRGLSKDTEYVKYQMQQLKRSKK